MPAAAQMRGFERCVWFVVLFVTGDVRPPTPTELAAAKDVVAMVDAGDLSGLPPRLSPAARRELSMERLSSRATQLHDTHGSARGARELVAGHHATFAVAAERAEWQLFGGADRRGEIDELRAEPVDFVPLEVGELDVIQSRGRARQAASRRRCGADFFVKRDAERLTRLHTRQLERLGYVVQLARVAEPATATVVTC